MAKIPMLYKYSSISDALKIIESKKIKITQPSKFNDPFDCAIPNINYNFKDIEKFYLQKINIFIKQKQQSPIPENSKDYNSMISELKSDFKSTFNNKFFNELLNIKEDWNNHIDNYKILCLSKSNNSILMWSHYAKTHKGIVLGFDFNKDKAIYKKLQPVKYDKNLEITKSFFNKLFKDLINDGLNSEFSGKNVITEDKFTKIFFEHLLEYLFIKNNVWDYEKEYRLVTSNFKEDFLDFKEMSLREIIFGIKVTEKEKEDFLNKCNLKNIEFFTIEEKNRELEIKKVQQNIVANK